MHGCGTVFKVTPSGTLTTLHGFCSQSGCPDGNNPVAGLVPSDNGDFYGMTCCGGANGYGTVFRISPSGAFTTLYDFCSQRGCADGWGSRRALVQASDGDFYGTTYYGGIGGTSGAGTVFKVDPSGALRTVYRFCSDRFCAHGEHPDAGLVQATDGDFYGTTVDGGTNNGNGTVFKISPGGKLTRLYSFCAEGGCSDGYNPGGLIQATDGDF
jgi:uncharacterized repeat protein (TIGR03803 family)